MQTPNHFLNLTEISGAESEDGDGYRVMLHCFVEDKFKRRARYHSAYSDLTKDSGLTRERISSTDYRPKDVLLDVAYVSSLLRQWCHGDGKKLLG